MVVLSGTDGTWSNSRNMQRTVERKQRHLDGHRISALTGTTIPAIITATNTSSTDTLAHIFNNNPIIGYFDILFFFFLTFVMFLKKNHDKIAKKMFQYEIVKLIISPRNKEPKQTKKNTQMSKRRASQQPGGRRHTDESEGSPCLLYSPPTSNWRCLPAAASMYNIRWGNISKGKPFLRHYWTPNRRPKGTKEEGKKKKSALCDFCSSY